MIKNYFKIALRNISRFKIYSFVNIAGLAIGIACCLLILLFVKNELNYDRFNTNAARIFRINSEFNDEGQAQFFKVTSSPIGPTLKTDYPEIVEAVRLSEWGRVLFKSEDKIFYEDNFYLADQSFFKVFSFELIKGDKSTALADLNSIVIDKKNALKYFGNENPLGKILTVELRGKLKDFTVTGVLDEIKDPSHITPHFIIPFENIGENRLNNWWNFGYSTYLLLNDGSSAETLEAKFLSF